MRASAENFAIAEVSADTAYLSHKNVNAVAALGAEPFIPFKSNSLEPTGTSAWALMYHSSAWSRRHPRTWRGATVRFVCVALPTASTKIALWTPVKEQRRGAALPGLDVSSAPSWSSLGGCTSRQWP